MDKYTIDAEQLRAMIDIIDECAERGAFKGEELVHVGNLREELVALRESNKTVTPSVPRELPAGFKQEDKEDKE